MHENLNDFQTHHTPFMLWIIIVLNQGGAKISTLIYTFIYSRATSIGPPLCYIAWSCWSFNLECMSPFSILLSCVICQMSHLSAWDYESVNYGGGTFRRHRFGAGQLGAVPFRRRTFRRRFLFFLFFELWRKNNEAGNFLNVVERGPV